MYTPVTTSRCVGTKYMPIQIHFWIKNLHRAFDACLLLFRLLEYHWYNNIGVGFCWLNTAYIAILDLL